MERQSSGEGLRAKKKGEGGLENGKEAKEVRENSDRGCEERGREKSIKVGRREERGGTITLLADSSLGKRRVHLRNGREGTQD